MYSRRPDTRIFSAGTLDLRRPLISNTRRHFDVDELLIYPQHRVQSVISETFSPLRDNLSRSVPPMTL